MALLKEIEEKKNALKKAEAVEKKELEELIVKDGADYNRLIKETYFEHYYSLIQDFTFKSDIR